VRPCIGQSDYQLVHVNMADKSVPVYVGPSSFLADQGIKLVPGEQMRSAVARTGDTLTALRIEVDGRSVALRDERGRPLWEHPRIAH
jgi:hypothetical protein